jgi:predicted peroxiredoxin
MIKNPMKYSTMEMTHGVENCARLAESFYNTLNAVDCDNDPELFEYAMGGAIAWGEQSTMWQKMLDEQETN